MLDHYILGYHRPLAASAFIITALISCALQLIRVRRQKHGNSALTKLHPLWLGRHVPMRALVLNVRAVDAV